MEQKTFFTILKKTIREEVRNVIKQELSEILKEGLQSTVNEIKTDQLQENKTSLKKSKKVPKFKKTGFADILNETTSLHDPNPVSKYASIMNESYNDLSFTSADAPGFGMMRQNTQPQAPAVMQDPETGKNMKVDPVVAKAMTKDYSALMKAIDEKKGNR